MAEVCVQRQGDVALVVIDRPPVNALNHDVREGLLQAFKGLEHDTSVASVVLICAGRTFVAGSDIAEFDQPVRFPVLPDVLAVLDNMSKPVTAALFGTVLGGGLELALGCHYRAAAPDTRLGLPEITLGLMPGAGGTQRLPRLVGMTRALAMILTGKPISGRDAYRDGLVDLLAESDIVGAAIAFSREVAGVRPIPRARDRQGKLQALRADPGEFDRAAAAQSKNPHDPEAVEAALAALRSVTDMPIDEALHHERQSFIKLRDSDKGKARRHIFFAEREASRIADLPAGIGAREIKNAAVIGAGTMGSGIAMCFADAGIPVVLVETDAAALKRGVERIAQDYKGSVSRGRIDTQDADRRIALIRNTTDLNIASEADIVIEAAFEEMAVKTEIFAALDGVAKDRAILATNTSYLDVNEIARATGRADAVLGMHFFSPANVMRLVEIVRAAKTAPDVAVTAIKLARTLGKIPVVVGVGHGFVGNRMMRVRSVEAERLLLEGALPQEVDAAMTEFGFPMGPFAVGDLAGLDISWRMRKAQNAAAPIADQLCEAGRFGQKTGKGFYRYEPGSRRPLPDPEVESLIVATSRRMGVPRRAFDRQDIVERLLFPMVNEGARILQEGIARQSSDIDVIWVYGYGFPAWRGGPMYYAARVGFAKVCAWLDKFADATGDSQHKPTPLFLRLAQSGAT